MADTHLHMPTSPMFGPNTAFGLDHSISMVKAIMSSRARSPSAARASSTGGGRAPDTRLLMSQQATTRPARPRHHGRSLLPCALDVLCQGPHTMKARYLNTNSLHDVSW